MLILRISKTTIYLFIFLKQNKTKNNITQNKNGSQEKRIISFKLKQINHKTW